MKKHKKEMVKLATIEFISRFFDIVAPFYEASTVFRQSAREYMQKRSVEKEQFWQQIAYLKRKGIIEEYVEGKDKFYELSKKGKRIVAGGLFKNIKIHKPNKWDGLWRVIVFDVPEKLRQSRDVLRRKLFELNFYQIQKSVYVFPYECTEEISYLANNLMIGDDVIIMVSEIIQGEENIIEFFVDRKIIDKKDLENKNS